MFHLAPQYLDLKNRVLKDSFFYFCEYFNETSENIKQTIFDNLSKYKFYFVHLSAYWKIVQCKYWQILFSI